MKKTKMLIIVISGIFLAGFWGCAPDCMNGLGPKNLSITWDRNRAYEVNTAPGGGHRIYYLDSQWTDISEARVIDVPNSVSQTSGTIPGVSGQCSYYVRVGAYSALNPEGGALSPLMRSIVQ